MIKNVLLISMVFLLTMGIMGCSNSQEEDPDMTATESNSDETKETETAAVNTISAEKAMEMMASGEAYTLIDVRTQSEYDEGHIEGALLLPSDQLEALAAEQLKDKDAVILVYCRSGNRSASASKLLVELGYTNVYDFGGIIDWPGEIVK